MIILLCSLIAGSCSLFSRRHQVLTPAQFAPVYTDLAVATFSAKKAGLDSANTAHRIDSILTRYDVTPEQLQASLDWYNADVRRWKPFFDSLMQRLDAASRSELNRP